MWIHQRGGLLALTLGGDSAVPDVVTTEFLGWNASEPTFSVPQMLVPAGHWQCASPAAVGGDPEPVLVSCVVAPGFDFAHFELCDG